MTAWSLETAKPFDQALAKLDRQDARRIVGYLLDAVTSGDPRTRGSALTANRTGYWRYRVGDYRVIVLIEDHRMTVVALEAGHRTKIYRD